MAGRYYRLLASAGARGVVLVTGGPAADAGLLRALEEEAASNRSPMSVRAHPRSVLAGAIGAAIWGAFRARRLASRPSTGPGHESMRVA